MPISAVATGIVIFCIPLKPVHGDMKHKLLVVDYLGTVLTLGGCSLILLPLIWVCNQFAHVFMHVFDRVTW
jgi:hypothetical protein